MGDGIVFFLVNWIVYTCGFPFKETLSEKELNIYTISAVNGRVQMNLGKKVIGRRRLVMGLHTWVRIPDFPYYVDQDWLSRAFLIYKYKLSQTEHPFILDYIETTPIIQYSIIFTPELSSQMESLALHRH